MYSKVSLNKSLSGFVPPSLVLNGFPSLSFKVPYEICLCSRLLNSKNLIELNSCSNVMIDDYLQYRMFYHSLYFLV